ncbi:MAG TPA: glycerophosphodiester phosphodiesterase [Telluria sp.]|nr:glycerophosphodiester phosphodiesterase [Telluria sp.]
MWPYPKVLAHRGGGKLAPENTLAGFRRGFEHGYRAAEFDVMLARDSTPVVMHDPHLGRTVNGTGNVFDYDAAELQQLDAGSWFGAAYADVTVPSYEAVLHFCREHGIWMNVEIKPAPGFELDTGRVVAEVTARHFRPGDPLLPEFSSFEPAALDGARAAVPWIPRGRLFDHIPPDWLDQARAQDVSAIHCNHLYLTPALAAAVKQAGYGLFCYTVNDPERARVLLGWGVDAFCTDRIDLIGADFAD